MAGFGYRGGCIPAPRISMNGLSTYEIMLATSRRSREGAIWAKVRPSLLPVLMHYSRISLIKSHMRGTS
jgi:hypothetical protein